MGRISTLLIFTVYSMNIVLLIGALFAIYVCLSDQRQKELGDILPIDFEYFTLFPKVLLTVSIIVAIVSFIGCFGTAVDNDCILIAYVIILGILMISKIFILIFLSHALSSSKSTTGGEDLRKKVLDAIKSNPSSSAFFAFQRKFACCGVDGPEDWNELFENKKIPGSCCKKNDDKECDTSQYFGKKGCKQPILDGISKVLERLIRMMMLVVFCILILMDIGKSAEFDTSEDIVFVGQIKNLPNSEEGDLPLDEIIDTHDMWYKGKEHKESPVSKCDEKIVGLNDNEKALKKHMKRKHTSMANM